MQESEHFTQELSLDINYSSRFVQYSHYQIACCLPRFSTVAHNYNGKKKNLTAKRKRLTAKRITSRQKEKDSRQKEKSHVRQKEKDSKQKENLTAKRKRLTTKFLRYREDILILISFAVRSWLFFLP